MTTLRRAHRRPLRTGTVKALAAVLVVLVLLPALIYSAYQLNALSAQEALIEQIYLQQLDVVLFSINQYAWDVVTSWFGDIRRSIAEGSTLRSEQELVALIRSSPSIQGIFETDSAGSDFRPLLTTPNGDLPERIRRHPVVFERLSSRARSGYRAVESFQDEHDPSTIVLLTTNAHPGGSARVLGIVVNVETFVNYVLAPKLNDAAGDEFLFAVTVGEDRRFVYATGETDPSGLRQSRDLWILPHYALWVRLQSGTIEELAANRFKETLGLVIALDILLLGGAWLVFRLARREIELAQLRSDFISSVSHELRTPLSLIRMSAETLLLGRVSGPARIQEHHQIIVRETDRLTRLVNNVLLYSRLESGSKQLEFVDVNLSEVVGRILEDYAPEFQRRGFVVEIQLSEVPARTRLNTEALTEALLNLLDNAMKFSAEHRTLKVRTGSQPGEVYVEVEDSGIGIPRELQSKIFERFYRVTASAENQKRGSGLGLALVKQIMDTHSGRVDLWSRPGQGSTFRLTFSSTAESDSSP